MSAPCTDSTKYGFTNIISKYNTKVICFTKYLGPLLIGIMFALHYIIYRAQSYDLYTLQYAALNRFEILGPPTPLPLPIDN